MYDMNHCLTLSRITSRLHYGRCIHYSRLSPGGLLRGQTLTSGRERCVQVTNQNSNFSPQLGNSQGRNRFVEISSRANGILASRVTGIACVPVKDSVEIASRVTGIACVPVKDSVEIASRVTGIACGTVKDSVETSANLRCRSLPVSVGDRTAVKPLIVCQVTGPWSVNNQPAGIFINREINFSALISSNLSLVGGDSTVRGKVHPGAVKKVTLPISCRFGHRADKTSLLGVFSKARDDFSEGLSGTLSGVQNSRRGDKITSFISSRFYSTWTLASSQTVFCRSQSQNSSSLGRTMGQKNSCTYDVNVNQNAGVSSSSTAGPGNDGGSSTDAVEAVVCSTDGLQDGETREVEVGEHKVLLVKEAGQFYAVGNKCTHYGAPLSKGAYCNGVIRCPWHGACFNVKTGDIEDFPGLDSLQKFHVEVRGTDVVVKADQASLANFRRVKPMVRKSNSSDKSVVIVGGGPASVVCAETLRQEGFAGKITLVSRDKSLPYDRIKLSKTLSVKAEEIALRKADFYKEKDIEVLLEQEVTKVDSAAKQVILSGGGSLSYTSLVLATGGQPRRLNIPGQDLANIFVLRKVEDANSIADKIKDKNVVVLGSSFIGLEVAGFLVGKAASVTVIGRSDVPLSGVFGEDIGLWIKKLHEGKGVKFISGTSIAEFEGANGELSSVKLENDTIIPADACVLGIGVTPATSFLEGSELNMTERGYVSVDKHMRTNIQNIYAAGDITEFPLSCMGDKSVNIQHWQMAHQHGRIAGLHIAGKAQAINSVPYFWTVQYGKSIRYAGYGNDFDDIILHGNVDEGKFLAFFTKDGHAVAAASCGWDPVVSQFANLLAKGDVLPKETARGDPTGWIEKLHSSQ